MSKVFRLHTGASDNVQDWSRLHSYLDTTAISTIKDPAGGHARRQITSIPSPFARIDLVKRAFQQVVDSGSLSGNTIYHKMVADALDIGQIFFNYPQLSEKIELIPWNPGLDWVGEDLRIQRQSDLGKLLSDKSSGQRLLGETLKMYFSQDRKAYNFDVLRQFYLVNYKNGSERLNIIGATSPASLFLSSGNELNDVKIQFGPFKVFDESFRPLYERNEDFILYMYALEKSIPNFSTRFRSLNAYLEATLPNLSGDLRKRIDAMDSGYYEGQYDPIVFEHAGNVPEVLGHPLRSVRIDSNRPQHSSDFVIASTKQQQKRLPLVLPNVTFNTNLYYVDTPWPAHLKAPYLDHRPLEDRTLPGLEVKYPYLTVNDLLEPYLVQLPYEPNRDKFFAGRLSAGGQDGYLIPVTPLFFEYFNTSDLIGTGPDGQPMFEFSRLPSNAIKAKLRIPIRKNKTIELERIYHASSSQSSQQPEESANRGVISPQQFSMVVYPFVRRESGYQGFYTVMHIDRDVDSNMLAKRYSMQYFRNEDPGTPVEVIAQKKKSDKRLHLVSTSFELLQGDFDFAFVENGKSRACVIPLMPEVPAGNQQFSFAIDFGTTNTHIEYTIDNGRPKPFEMTAADSQIGMMHKSDDATYARLLDARFGIGATQLLDTVSQELMPELIGAGQKHRFPARTVVSEPKQMDFYSESFPLVDFSIYWPYEQINRPSQLQYYTNLKWSNISQKPDEKKRIEGYIATLLQLVRNKVVLNGGNLAKTRIVWFYPSSMSQFRLNTFEKIWSENIARYLGPDIDQMSIPESVAPFYFFRSEEGVVAGNHPVINIDIGGGTTDVVVYEGQQVRSYTSFKFAANKLFGDGYGNNPRSNGFVLFFERNFRKLLDGSTLDSIYKELEVNGRSEDIISFLFGLENNPGRQKLDFSFGEKLRETPDLKIVPLLFVSAIFYHVAKFQRAQGGALPRYITFSGTGSKVLNILDASSKLTSVKKLCNLIFNEVFETDQSQIDLKMTPGPKEGTAKGGLLDPQVPTMPKSVLSGAYHKNGFQPEMSLQEASSAVRQGEVLNEVSKFIELFFAWNKRLNYHDEFALDPSRFEQYRAELTRDLDVFLQEGLADKRVEMNGRTEEPMDETMFFFPLTGSLNKLAYSIAEAQTNP
jgi:hypothetical protein